MEVNSSRREWVLKLESVAKLMPLLHPWISWLNYFHLNFISSFTIWTSVSLWIFDESNEKFILYYSYFTGNSQTQQHGMIRWRIARDSVISPRPQHSHQPRSFEFRSLESRYKWVSVVIVWIAHLASEFIWEIAIQFIILLTFPFSKRCEFKSTGYLISARLSIPVLWWEKKR